MLFNLFLRIGQYCWLAYLSVLEWDENRSIGVLLHSCRLVTTFKPYCIPGVPRFSTWRMLQLLNHTIVGNLLGTTIEIEIRIKKAYN